MTTTRQIDLTGMKCPMPIVQLTKLIKELGSGDEITAVANDPAFCLDVEAWCNRTGHQLVQFDDADGRLVAVIRKKHEV